MISCGIDFGTSNSSIALSNHGKVNLVPVERNQFTIPSALFYQHKTHQPFFGREAAELFFARKEGRFMRSLKRVLGTDLMKHGTSVNGRVMKFENIIACFLDNLKVKAEEFSGQPLDRVVIGRPVHFMDGNPSGDKKAQEELAQIARQIGFKEIAFQLEPIAAAFAHEVNVKEERLALVADLGGGTSDFTVIRLSNQYMHKVDRSSDILANTGVRIGGNDFDKDLSLKAIMPALGYGTTYGSKNLEVPIKPYHDLAEWSRVNLLYTVKLRAQVKQILYEAHDKRKYERLVKILQQETGHTVLAATEETKIALTSYDHYSAPFDFIEKDLRIPIQRTLFEEAIHEHIQRIEDTVKECLHQAQVGEKQIDLVLLTGGTTEVPMVQNIFKRLFPSAALADENKLSSVGLGLAYDSLHKFGM